MAFKMKYGSRQQVWNGTAEMTTGKLKLKDLMKNKRGEIVSVKKHNQGLQAYSRVASRRAPPFERLED